MAIKNPHLYARRTARKRYKRDPVACDSLDKFADDCRAAPALDCSNEAHAPTGEMAVTPPSIKKSAPTTYAESSDAR
jgi:hypothetical protein